MKKKKSLGIGWSILLLSLAISLIDMIVPEGYQGAPFFLAIVTWNVWLFKRKIIPFCKRKKQQREEKKANNDETLVQQDSVKAQALVNALNLHVNLRITECLHAIYPNTTWAWLEKDSTNLILQGGIGRIRVNGVEDYDCADVKFEKNGSISLSMVKQMPELRVRRKTEPAATPKQPLNPQIWYEKQGRAVLQNVITDLHSRGHATLTISENGSILIEENEEAVTHGSLADFPAKSYWNQLVQVLQRDGLSAKIEPTGLQLTW